MIGSDPSGVPYGCMEMARQSAAAKTMPERLDATDEPTFAMRGTNLFWMNRGDYDWAVIPCLPWQSRPRPNSRGIFICLRTLCLLLHRPEEPRQ